MKSIYLVITVVLLNGCGGGGSTAPVNDTADTQVLNANGTEQESGSNDINEANTTQDTDDTNDTVTKTQCVQPTEQNLSSSNFAYAYLNMLRCMAGVPRFTIEGNLTKAAQTHSAYMEETGEYGHYETNTSAGSYRGEYPFQRAIAAGYASKVVSENVSKGNPHFLASIDSLFSAIYHRFSFLSLERDEIGIGKTINNYVYDMGNHSINLACQNSADTQSGWEVCTDDTLRYLSNDDYLEARDSLKEKVPAAILWPPKYGTGIPPVFFEESPDPLPNQSVSGYPISVLFNDQKVDANVTINRFTLTDSDGDTVPLITTINKENDPNHIFTSYEFAIFPKNRLAWGSAYYVDLSYNDQGQTYEEKWCFSTKSLKDYGAERVYTIAPNDGDDVEFSVEANKTYAIYLIPRDENDTFSGYHVPYTATIESMSILDGNTLLVKLSGEINTYAEFSFSNKRNVKLTLSNRDNASTPQTQRCEE